MTAKAREVSARIRGAGTLDDVRGATERYLELRRQAFRAAVDITIEMGQIVIEVKKRVGSLFDEWLDSVGTTERSAHNYTTLARMAEEHPGVYPEVEGAGTDPPRRIASIRKRT